MLGGKVKRAVINIFDTADPDYLVEALGEARAWIENGPLADYIESNAEQFPQPINLSEEAKIEFVRNGLLDLIAIVRSQ